MAKETGRKVHEITPEGERTLGDWALKTAGIEAAFVHAYPRKSRPFYTLPAEGNRTHAFGLELAGLASVKEASLFPRDRERTRQ